jgi:hypothetical protein
MTPCPLKYLRRHHGRRRTYASLPVNVADDS